MIKYYLDTSILLDYYEKRENNDYIALKLIEKIILNNDTIIYSDIHIKELKKIYSKEELLCLIREIKTNKIFVHVSRWQRIEARKISQTKDVPFLDILHAIIARDNESILVSNDKDFIFLKNITLIKTPRELL